MPLLGALPTALEFHGQFEQCRRVQLAHPRFGDPQHLGDLFHRQVALVVQQDDEAVAPGKFPDGVGQLLQQFFPLYLRLRARTVVGGDQRAEDGAILAEAVDGEELLRPRPLQRAVQPGQGIFL